MKRRSISLFVAGLLAVALVGGEAVKPAAAAPSRPYPQINDKGQVV
jgi:hypothetical protein